MSLIPREAIVLLPPEVDSRLKLFEFLGFEALRAANQALELFVVVFRTLPGNPFAVVMGLRKDVVHIQGQGWPPQVCPRKRMVVVYNAGELPL